MSKYNPEIDFRSAGYVLIRTPAAPEGLKGRSLLTSKVISICECLFPRFPDAYAIEWCASTDEARDEDFDAMGIPEDQREDAMEWATETFDEEHGAWGFFFTLEAARAARSRFLKDSNRIHLIGLGVHPDDVKAYVKSNQPPKPQPGYSPEGTMGQVSALMADQPLAPGGTFLGYELLETAHRIMGCSWLCYGYEENLAEEVNIKPNEFGLISSYDDARRGADLINTQTKGSPAIWMPWALIEYKLK